MKRFVDACHQRGMAVVLDVVYNHLGPEGNYLRDFGPYFTARYQTPWGEAVNFDGDQSDPVRAYFIQNALHWFERYHVDALRLDAVHAIYDMRPTHVLRELAEAAEEWGGRHGKRPYLIAESHMNKPRLVEPRAVGGYGLDSMWSDDFHHGVHTLLTGELEGYYMDYGRLEHLADSVRDGFAFRGQYSPYRGRSHGEPCAHLPGSAFVINIQTHDMVGNRALGERLTGLVSLEAHKAAAALMLFSPYVPLLFMGEEWAETNPFLYFIHHGDPDLVEAVRKGRKREFESFHWDEDPPDPQSEATFQRSKLDWDKPGQGRHKAMLDFYRECLRLRRTLPALADMRRDHMHVWPMHRRNTLFVQRGLGQEMVLLLCNLSRNACPVDTAEFFPDGQWTKILDSTAERWAGPGVTLADTPGDGQSLPPESLALYARKENP
jgi:maltooligosyltrehalose trehalohydrolase